MGMDSESSAGSYLMIRAWQLEDRKKMQPEPNSELILFVEQDCDGWRVSQVREPRCAALRRP